MNARTGFAAAGLPAFGLGAKMPIYDANALTGVDGKATILLNGQEYTLRITRQGKLLLTK